MTREWVSVQHNMLSADFVEAINVALGYGVPSADTATRNVFLTTVPGAYGPAGFVVTIEGTPPRGFFVADLTGGRVIDFGNTGRARTLNAKATDTVWLFIIGTVSGDDPSLGEQAEVAMHRAQTERAQNRRYPYT